MTITEAPTAFEAFGAFDGYEHRGAAHVDKITEEALSALRSLPIPTRKTEAWKYTPLNKILKANWKPAQPGNMVSPEELDIPSFDAHRVWVMDGEVIIEESHLPDGVTLCSMSEALESERAHFEDIYGQQADHKNDILIAVNTAYAVGGIYLRLAKNVQLDKPIHVVHAYTQPETAVCTRNIIIAEQGSQGWMTHSFVHLHGPIHSNVITEVKVADNAQFTLDKFQTGLEDSYHYSSEEIHQGRDAVYTQNTMTTSGAWTRNDPRIRLLGQNSVCHLNGAYVPRGKQLVDNHSIIDHLVPNCESHEMYKGVVYEQGKAVFNGKVFVRPDAQKTNAYQQNANILMSTEGSMNSKPELEIYADDVKCSHGSTTGQLDQDALFYLQCRGLSYQNAKQMLVNAFIGEVVERLELPEMQDWVWGQLEG
jgi:Fe-S cluster assembly protein SufD